MSAFGKWSYSCDREATVEAYSQASAGGVETCGCIWCRNFLLVRDHTFPPAFAELLHSLGINPHRDGEVYHNGRLAPGVHDCQSAWKGDLPPGGPGADSDPNTFLAEKTGHRPGAQPASRRTCIQKRLAISCLVCVNK